MAVLSVEEVPLCVDLHQGLSHTGENAAPTRSHHGIPGIGKTLRGSGVMGPVANGTKRTLAFFAIAA